MTKLLPKVWWLPFWGHSVESHHCISGNSLLQMFTRYLTSQCASYFYFCMYVTTHRRKHRGGMRGEITVWGMPMLFFPPRF